MIAGGPFVGKSHLCRESLAYDIDKLRILVALRENINPDNSWVWHGWNRDDEHHAEWENIDSKLKELLGTLGEKTVVLSHDYQNSNYILIIDPMDLYKRATRYFENKKKKGDKGGDRILSALHYHVKYFQNDRLKEKEITIDQAREIVKSAQIDPLIHEEYKKIWDSEDKQRKEELSAAKYDESKIKGVGFILDKSKDKEEGSDNVKREVKNE